MSQWLTGPWLSAYPVMLHRFKTGWEAGFTLTVTQASDEASWDPCKKRTVGRGWKKLDTKTISLSKSILFKVFRASWTWVKWSSPSINSKLLTLATNWINNFLWTSSYLPQCPSSSWALIELWTKQGFSEEIIVGREGSSRMMGDRIFTCKRRDAMVYTILRNMGNGINDMLLLTFG